MCGISCLASVDSGLTRELRGSFSFSFLFFVSFSRFVSPSAVPVVQLSHDYKLVHMPGTKCLVRQTVAWPAVQFIALPKPILTH